MDMVVVVVFVFGGGMEDLMFWFSGGGDGLYI